MAAEFSWQIFFEVLFLQNGLADGLMLTLGLALLVWTVGLIIGFLLAEAKFALPNEQRFIINFVLWLFKSVPILPILILLYFASDQLNLPQSISRFMMASLAMVFWAAANLTDICFRSKQYRITHATSSTLSSWIFLPQAMQFLAQIITVTPLVAFIALPDFFYLINHQIRITFSFSEILVAGIVVYLILIGIISIVAKILASLLKVPENLY